MTTDIDTLKGWFKTGDKPTQDQFYAWMDSYWHKNEGIPVAKIEDLQRLLDDKQPLLQSGVNIRNLSINNQPTTLLGSGTLSLDTGLYYNHNHVFGQDAERDNEIIDPNTLQGELEDISAGYTQFGLARLLQLTIRFRSLDNIQGLMCSWEALGFQISNDFASFHGTGAVIARISNGQDTELVEVEAAYLDAGSGFRVTSNSSTIIGGSCSLTVFLYGIS